MTESDLPIWRHEPTIKIPHTVLNDAANVVGDYYKEHLRRDVADGRLRPGDGWLFVRGLLISAMQTYAGICLLLSKKRPKPLMLQASVLGRLLFEILTTVMALVEDLNGRTPILVREYVKMLAVTYKRYADRYSDDPTWADYLTVFRTRLDDLVKSTGIPPEIMTNPKIVLDEWPTPGRMLKGSGEKPPFVSGSRHAVLKTLYESHYASLSAQAHARMAAISMAMLVDHPEERWNPGQDESNIVTTALLCLCCLLTEIEAAGGYGHHPKLAEVWTYLRSADGETQDIWALRYEQLVADLPSP